MPPSEPANLQVSQNSQVLHKPSVPLGLAAVALDWPSAEELRLGFRFLTSGGV